MPTEKVLVVPISERVVTGTETNYYHVRFSIEIVGGEKAVFSVLHQKEDPSRLKVENHNEMVGFIVVVAGVVAICVMGEVVLNGYVGVAVNLIADIKEDQVRTIVLGVFN